MKNLLRRGAIFAVMLALLLSITCETVSAAPSVYSKEKNLGTRGETAVSLSGTGASSYYTGDYTYEELSQLEEDELLTELRTLLTTTQKYVTSYANCRDYAKYTDCQNGSDLVTLLYTSKEVARADFGGSSPGWNREHVWPKSLGGFDDDSPGAGTDIHHIRPSNVKTNETRGNKKYGNVNGGSTAYGDALVGTDTVGGTYNSSYYEPLDNVKGDVARICLYVYVRWGGVHTKSSNINNVFQSVDVLLEWCESDPVDTWELGRNEVAAKYQGNRNVFIDYPEYAWLLFGREVPDDMVTPSGMAMAGGEEDGNGGSGEGGEEITPPPVCEHKVTKLVGAYPATCEKEGYTGDTVCDSCKKVIEKGKATEKASHALGEWTKVDGENKLTHACTACGESFEGGKDPACTHPAESKLIFGKTDGNCSEFAYSGDTYCGDCGKLLMLGCRLPYGSHAYAPSSDPDLLVCIYCGSEKTLGVENNTPIAPPEDPSADAGLGTGAVIAIISASVAAVAIACSAAAIFIIKAKKRR